MINASNFPRLTAFVGHCLAFLLVSAALIACSPDKQKAEDIRIRAISGEPFFRSSDTAQDRADHFSEPLLLNFDSSPFLSSASYGFFRLGESLSYATNQGHRQKGSVRVSNRTASWQGPLITLPPLEKGSYTASVWIKSINTERAANVKLVLMQVSDGDAVGTPLAEIEAMPGIWQKLEGRIHGIKNGGYVSALRMEVSADIDYLIDDVVIDETASLPELDANLESEADLEQKALTQPVSLDAELIVNGDLEDGIEPWSHQGGKISRSNEYAHSGDYSLLISDRKLEWHAPMMSLHGLQDDELYHFSIFVRLTEAFPEAKVQFTLKQLIGGKPIFTPIATHRVTNTGWTEVAGVIGAANFSISEQTSVYLECANAFASYYVDDLTVERQ